MAGAAGLEPAVTVLETVGLPVNRRSYDSLLNLLVLCVFLAKFAILRKLKALSMFLFIFYRVVVSSFAVCAFKSDYF